MSKNDKRVFDVLVVWISFCVLAHSSELGALWPSQKPKSCLISPLGKKMW